MSGSLSVLPLLTPRFLQHANSLVGDEDQICHDHAVTAIPEHQTSPAQAPADSTHMFLTDRWPKPAADHTHMFLTDRWAESCHDDDGNYAGITTNNVAVTPLKTGCPLPSNDNSVVPMWVSPTVSIPPSPVSSSPLAVTISPAHKISTEGFAPPPPPLTRSGDASALRDVPAVVFIRCQQSLEQHGESQAGSCCLFMEDYDDDVVSALADDPDEDDVDVLPHATYDVLANIFDEIYKDDSEVIEDDHGDVLS